MRKLILLITISLLLPLESAHATLAEGIHDLQGVTLVFLKTGALQLKSKRGSGAITIEANQFAIETKSGFKVRKTEAGANIEEIFQKIIKDPEKVELVMEELLTKLDKVEEDPIELIMQDLLLQSVKVQNPDQATLAKAVADAIQNMDTTDKQAIAAAELLGSNLLKILEKHDPNPAMLAKAVADAIQNMNPADKQAITNSVFSFLEEELEPKSFL